MLSSLSSPFILPCLIVSFNPFIQSGQFVSFKFIRIVQVQSAHSSALIPSGPFFPINSISAFQVHLTFQITISLSCPFVPYSYIHPDTSIHPVQAHLYLSGPFFQSGPLVALKCIRPFQIHLNVQVQWPVEVHSPHSSPFIQLSSFVPCIKFVHFNQFILPCLIVSFKSIDPVRSIRHSSPDQVILSSSSPFVSFKSNHLVFSIRLVQVEFSHSSALIPQGAFVPFKSILPFQFQSYFSTACDRSCPILPFKSICSLHSIRPFQVHSSCHV